MAATQAKHVCQVALSAFNGPALRNWYAQVFGLLRSGQTVFIPPMSSRVQGLPNAWERCGWLIDNQDYFQLEFFQFWSPPTQLKPTDWRPCDVGYSVMGIAVSQFDLVLSRVAALAGGATPAVSGVPGKRLACVQDPEGNWVAIHEHNPLHALGLKPAPALRPDVPAQVCCLRVSVPDLAAACATYTQALGLQPLAGQQLYTAQHEGLWGLAGAQAQTALFCADNFLLELVQYHQPAAKPWPPGYRISDQGFMNFALGFRGSHPFDTALQQAQQHGMRANGKVLDIGVFRVMYVNDQQGFSVELLNARPQWWSVSGFNPREPYVEVELAINAPLAQVWHKLVDHATMGAWFMLPCQVLRRGSQEPNGVGCLRRLSLLGLPIVEEVTEWHPQQHYAYQVRKGLHFRQHRGDVFVSECNGVTKVRWAIRFCTWVPFSGQLTAMVLRWLCARSLQNLRRQLQG